MSKRVQLIRHIRTAADQFLGLVGEITVNFTDNVLRVHDGASIGGIEQARKDLNNVPAATVSDDGKMSAQQAGDLATAKANIDGHIGSTSGHPVATSGADGFMASADKTLIDTIETGATADQTPAEILADLLTVDGSGSGLDADLFDGFEQAIAATVDTIMRRDVAGRSKVADPNVAADIATKGYVDGAGFPAGTTLLFHQNLAPTGWTKDVAATLDNSALRIVTNTAWVGGKQGATAFTSVFGAGKVVGGKVSTGTVGPTALSEAQGAVHGHEFKVDDTVGNSAVPSATNPIASHTGAFRISGAPDTILPSASIADSSGGSTHTHTLTMNSHDHTLSLDLNYINMIIASRD